jgi:spore germination protein YaaH
VKRLAIPLIILTCAAIASPERLFYGVGARNDAAVLSLESHAEEISAIGVIGYFLNRDGHLVENIDPRLLEISRRRQVKVYAELLNGAFEQSLVSEFLRSPDKQGAVIDQMIQIAQRRSFAGWQIDFENVAAADRDRLTAFYRKTADSLRAHQLGISIAVVPRTGEGEGLSGFSRWMFENWRGSYDYRALAEAGDFISYMTYDQHTKLTPPGPVAGKRWMEKALRYALGLGVAPSKISLGIPLYSHHWFAGLKRDRSGGLDGLQLPFAESRRYMALPGSSVKWLASDATTRVEFERFDTTEYVFVENARSFGVKQALVKQYGLRGFSAFQLGAEDPAIWKKPSVAERGRAKISE